MNIGIITFYWTDNFGANLQCYALSNYLKQMGHTVHVIQHRGDKVYLNDEKLKAVNFPYFKPKTVKYNAFAIKHFNLTPMVFNAKFKKTLSKLNLDVIICGSDQVWSSALVNFNPTFFGGDYNGTSDVILASYAASLGASNVADEVQKNSFQYNLHAFDYVCIREHNQQDLLEAAIGKKVHVCMDPTLLLNEIDYKPLMTDRLYSRPYIYNHYYYNKNLSDLHKFTTSLSRKSNLPIVASVSTPTYKFKQTVLEGTDNWAVEETLSAFYYSDYVTTSSFHAVVFSIMFKKRFWYILKDDATDNRIINLCESLGLEDRIIKSDQQLPDDFEKQPDWISVYKKLWDLRKTATDYLLSVTSHEKGAKANQDYLTSSNEYTCYCCGACADVCATNAITMTVNDEGFSFPLIDGTLCNHCGLCNKTCPYNEKPVFSDYNPQVYLSYSKNDDIYTNSSSGGIHQTIANIFLKQQGYVVGVAFDANFVAKYDIESEPENAKKFRYSKYVEAEHNDIFVRTRDALNTKKPVLFTGTPCKIAGLKNFLGKEYENLYTMELICHATPSPLVLKKWLEHKEAAAGSRLVHFQHRSPKKISRAQAAEYVYENGEEEIVAQVSDDYMKGYQKHLTIKKSCAFCEFCKENKIADITIGDFWGWERFYETEAPKGISALIVNNRKGDYLIDQVLPQLYLQPQNISDVYSANHSSPSKMHKNRSQFFNRLNQPNESIQNLFKELIN